ncbi:MAG: lysophospholipid acyltransferase family protein [Burkholderiales bacterium]
MRSSDARALGRLLGFGACALAGLGLATLVLPLADPAARARVARRWSRGVLAALGVDLDTTGTPLAAAMLVANHVSWLDVIALSAIQPAAFVAKAELRRWPLAGTLIVRSGAIFIDRGRMRDILRVNAALRARLAGGCTVAVFPEATTTDGAAVAPFRNALVQAAIDAGARVQPVAIAYVDALGARAPQAAYCGDTSFWQCLLAIARADGIRARLDLLPALEVRTLTRREVGALARTRIAATLDQTRRQHQPALPPEAAPARAQVTAMTAR